MSDWKYIIRFEVDDGKTYYGRLDEPAIPTNTLHGHTSIQAAQAGDSGSIVSIRKLLSPTPIQKNEIVCIGTNYAEHAKESGASLSLPKMQTYTDTTDSSVPSGPVMWYKPQRSLAGPGDISIPKSIQDQFLDFEGELTILTSKDAKDVSIESAEDYILGYVVGNDLTARMFQDPRRAGGHFTRAKCFDNFAPVGPILASKEVFGGLEGETVKTTVNGKVLQDSGLDLIHGPAKLLSFLSIGTTLPAGTLIMTGTPSGIGWFQEPKYSLRDGDVVEVEITSLGKLSNTIKFD